jgi:DNA-binding transcriptional MerR regulator
VNGAVDSETADRRLTIGAVCATLKREYPGISISKIRYLEDQGLLAPRRTRGGYRLYGEDDVDRLRRILQLQRDEFLPLRVIREELAKAPGDRPRGGRRRPPGELPDRGLTLEELCTAADVLPQLVRELEEFHLLAATDGLYRREDAQIVAVAGALAAYGVGARHLRAFYGAIQREAGLLEQLLSPSLRSRNPERRSAGLEDLQELAGLAAQLTEHVLLRDLRRLAGPNA